MSSIKLKATAVYFVSEELRENRLFKGSTDKDGNISISTIDLHTGKKRRIRLSRSECGAIRLENGGEVLAEFVEMKTKTIACTHVNHAAGGKKHFKSGVRYQIESGRALGGVAGMVFDEDGDRWTLMREEVGFSAGAGTYLFEAKCR